MESREFAKYHTWCDERGIRVYPIPTGVTGQFNLAVERDGRASIGQHIFYDKPSNSNQVSVWDQIGVLLKAIVFKELKIMEIKSTYSNLESICTSAIKGDKKGIVNLLIVVPFREAILYLEAFYPEHKEKSKLIYKLAHCKCGEPAYKWDLNPIKPICRNCSLKKGLSQIEYSKV